MENNLFNIHIERNYPNNQYSIWMIRNYPNPTNISFDGKTLTYTEFNPGDLMSSQNCNPLLRIPADMFDILLQEIIRFNDDRGYKTKDENRLEGELKATKYHLEDMRSLVFKDLTL